MQAGNIAEKERLEFEKAYVTLLCLGVFLFSKITALKSLSQIFLKSLTKCIFLLYFHLFPVSDYSEVAQVKSLNIGKASKTSAGREYKARGISLPKNLVHLWQKSFCFQEKSIKNLYKSFCSKKISYAFTNE